MAAHRAELAAICARRGLAFTLEETLRAADITEDAKAAGLRDFGQAIRRRGTEIRMRSPGT